MGAKGKTRLQNLVVNEVSLVDRAANGKRFLISKRDSTVTEDTPTAPDAEAVAKAAVEAAAAAQAEAVQKAVADAVAVAKAAHAAELAAIETAKAEAIAKADADRVAIEKRLADQIEAAEVAESVQKAASVFKNLPVKPEVLGPDLRQVRKVDAALADRLEVLLKACEAAAVGLLAPVGSSAAGEASGSAWEEITKRANGFVAAKAVSTFAEGVNKALSEDKALYLQHEAEKVKR